MDRKIVKYKSDEIIVSYEPAICIHAAECVRGLPGVFDPRKKPWVNLEGSDPGEVADVVKRCPSGALRFERLDGGTQEDSDPENSIITVKNGPLFLRGNIRIHDDSGELIREENRIALCRCGKSNNKPFCDNSH